MDPFTKEEVKIALVATVTAMTMASEEALCNAYRTSSAQLRIPVQTLLAELIIEDKLVQKLFRLAGRPAYVCYFPVGTVNGHFLQTEMKARVQYRPANFDQLGPEEQWAWDKALGILDWRGEA